MKVIVVIFVLIIVGVFAVVSVFMSKIYCYNNKKEGEKDNFICWGDMTEEEKSDFLYTISHQKYGFKVGDKIRLKDGDGRHHIIKSFGRVEGVHGPDFFIVHFEDNAATGFLAENYCDMIKIKE